MWYFQFTSKCAPKVWMESSKIILEMDEGFNRSEVRKSLHYIQRGMFGVKRECLEATWKQFVKKKMINMVLDLLVLFEPVLSILCFDLKQSFPRVLKLGSLKWKTSEFIKTLCLSQVPQVQARPFIYLGLYFLPSLKI